MLPRRQVVVQSPPRHPVPPPPRRSAGRHQNHAHRDAPLPAQGYPVSPALRAGRSRSTAAGTAQDFARRPAPTVAKGGGGGRRGLATLRVGEFARLRSQGTKRTKHFFICSPTTTPSSLGCRPNKGPSHPYPRASAMCLWPTLGMWSCLLHDPANIRLSALLLV
jgi:hypothetical protein